MKIFISQYAYNFIGGGGTFTRNLIKALTGKVQFVDKITECDIYFIPGPTLVSRDEVYLAKKLKKKIILRVDNIPRNSRNRNTGTSRLYDFAQIADEVVYQSNWAKKWIYPFIKKDGVVILNGADASIFNPQGPSFPKEGSPQYLYSRYNRDETKMWEKVWYEFQKIYYENPKAHLWLVGRFSDKLREYNFDFFGGAEKRYTYLGVINDPKRMAEIYRGADFLIYPYILDACSNVLIEAIMCGTKIIYFGNGDGGAMEILKADKKDLTLEVMGKKYLQLFQKVVGDNKK